MRAERRQQAAVARRHDEPRSRAKHVERLRMNELPDIVQHQEAGRVVKTLPQQPDAGGDVVDLRMVAEMGGERCLQRLESWMLAERQPIDPVGKGPADLLVDGDTHRDDRLADASLAVQADGRY